MSDLYLAEIYLDAADMVRMGNAKGFPRLQTTENYLTHCALGELFGEHKPLPFWIDPDSKTDRYFRVLGYTSADRDGLLAHADLFAEPSRHNLLDRERLQTKAMPTLPGGLTVGFNTWAVPTIRKGTAGSVETFTGETRVWCGGQELDYFLDRTWHIGPDVTRADAYQEWVQHQFDVRDTGAELSGPITMSAFKQVEMCRRSERDGNGKRTMKTLGRRPAAALHGTMTVTDPHVFRQFLASGIGQHKHFGYGMLKLRPA